MAARKSAADVGVRKNIAVFTRVPVRSGLSSRRTYRYFRQPFNFVEFDWGNGETSYLVELVVGHRFHTRTAEETESYDDIRFMEPSELNQGPSIDRSDKCTR